MIVDENVQGSWAWLQALPFSIVCWQRSPTSPYPQQLGNAAKIHILWEHLTHPPTNGAAECSLGKKTTKSQQQENDQLVRKLCTTMQLEHTVKVLYYEPWYNQHPRWFQQW